MLPDSALINDCCLACLSRNRDLPELKRDPHHSGACLRHTGASVTERHDGVARVVAERARSVGATVRLDQPRLGPALVNVTDPETGETSEQVQHTDKRGDLLIVLGSKRLLVDVTIPRATAATNMANPAFQNPGDCTAAAEATKRDTYEELCKQRGLTLVPFALDSYRGVGKTARWLLSHLAITAMS
jgi:hypothetical protein